ncbi:DUF2283 domain-containing protein [Brevibacillus sp. SAFN-007a]|uniref:DUF2283 domain-containing protein n=1 Tax=Brevibacillus sp. SAFN-007a TaxID=3436862 RepID=UPI003F7FCB48
MAFITVEQIQKYVDSIKDWRSEGESTAKECLLINFIRDNNKSVVDEENINQTMYFQSKNGNVTIDFDETGQIVSIEIS